MTLADVLPVDLGGVPATWPAGFGRNDMNAVRALIERQRDVWRRRAPLALEEVYAEDVHWMNAFGSRLIGRTHVIRYLEALWATPQFQARNPVRDETFDLWFIDADAVVLHAFHSVSGQRSLLGEEIARRTHSEKIIVRVEAGWIIKSEVFFDERDQKQRLISRTQQAGDEIRPLTAGDVSSL